MPGFLLFQIWSGGRDSNSRHSAWKGSGIDTDANAALVAMRELRQASTPLARVVMVVNRAAWDTNPGDVIKLSWVAYGITGLILRVLAVNYGTFEQGLVRLECIEDIFGLPSSAYLSPVTSGWVEEAVRAEPAASTLAQELPYYAIQTTFEQTVLDALLEGAAFLEDVAENPPVTSFSFKLATRQGAAAYEIVDEGVFAPTLQLVGALDRTTKTSISIKNFRGSLGLVKIGGYAYIGAEALRIDALDLTLLTMDVGRGFLDTIPLDHNADKIVYFADGNTSVDPTEYAVSDSVNAKVLPQTSLSILPEGDAVEKTVVMVGRRDKPYPPAQVTIGGTHFPSTVNQNVSISVAWTHQDRTQQLVPGGGDWYTVALGSPEQGTTYEVRYYDVSGASLLFTDSGLTGKLSSFTPATAVGVPINIRVEIDSFRGGEKSLVTLSHEFTYTKPVGVRVLENVDNRVLENGDRRVLED